MTTPAYSIHFGEGVGDVLADCVKLLEENAHRATAEATSYEDLANGREAVIAQQSSLLRSLYQVLLSNQHDGDVRLFVDGNKSLFFRYDSGYHGGLIFHQHTDPLKSSWSIHT